MRRHLSGVQRVRSLRPVRPHSAVAHMAGASAAATLLSTRFALPDSHGIEACLPPCCLLLASGDVDGMAHVTLLSAVGVTAWTPCHLRTMASVVGWWVVARWGWKQLMQWGSDQHSQSKSSNHEAGLEA